VHVRPEEIRSYRERHGLSRARLAAQLGVSATSIQNWELGRTASASAQLRLRALLDGAPVADPAAAANESMGDSRVRATAAIVAAYLQADGNLGPAEVPRLIRAVRKALEA
jgi:transcriptional regulator with XRE-family HTH domain